jgi:omega-6 fatty acid desaturase (delta-12 desaturase)
VDEYYENQWFRRLGYRFFRNPLVMFGLGPIFSFVVMNRLPFPKYGRREFNSVLLTDLAILVMIVSISLFIGLKGFLLIQLPIVMIGGGLGIWLFYVQHQFEDPYWERSENWDYVASALLGASYLRLPKVLNWFTGNIGFHHIHHLSPRIPNYNLAKAHQNIPLIKKWTRSFSLGEGLHFTRLKLWDEMIKKMIGFQRKQVPDKRL